MWDPPRLETYFSESLSERKVLSDVLLMFSVLIARLRKAIMPGEAGDSLRRKDVENCTGL
jgi:uncharacterized protein YfiM (DUF2279 family)